MLIEPGLAVAFWNVLNLTMCQRLVPNELLGRITSASRVSSLALTIVGSVVAGPVVRTIGFTDTLLTAAALVAVVALTPIRAIVRLSIDTEPA